MQVVISAVSSRPLACWQTFERSEKRNWGVRREGGPSRFSRAQNPLSLSNASHMFLWVTWRAQTTSAWKATRLVTQARPPCAVPKIRDQPRHCPKFRKIALASRWWKSLAPVFEKVDINAIPGINLHPVDSTISFRCTYLPDRDLWSFIRWIVACVAGGIGSECCCFLAAELRTPATAI